MYVSQEAPIVIHKIVLITQRRLQMNVKLTFVYKCLCVIDINFLICHKKVRTTVLIEV